MNLTKKQLSNKASLLRMRLNVMSNIVLLEDTNVLDDVIQEGVRDLLRHQELSLMTINNLLHPYGEKPLTQKQEIFRKRWKI